jgi:V/A-type H+-transporting ATPase subunit E
MTGLEKIIDRIIDDAKEKAREILEAAQNDCRATAEKYAREADDIRDSIADKAEKEGEAVIAKARSSAAMTRRNLLLSARGALLDEAFERAKTEVRDADFGKYRELLTALLTGALIEQAKAEDESLSLGDEVMTFDRFEVLFNAEDREKYGAAVVEAARRGAARHIGNERADKLRLSDETADIDGGLVLRYGDIEANCSLSTLFADMREEMEQKVAAVLFAEPGEEGRS